MRGKSFIILDEKFKIKTWVIDIMSQQRRFKIHKCILKKQSNKYKIIELYCFVYFNYSWIKLLHWYIILHRFSRRMIRFSRFNTDWMDSKHIIVKSIKFLLYILVISTYSYLYLRYSPERGVFWVWSKFRIQCWRKKEKKFIPNERREWI